MEEKMDLIRVCCIKSSLSGFHLIISPPEILEEEKKKRERKEAKEEGSQSENVSSKLIRCLISSRVENSTDSRNRIKIVHRTVDRGGEKNKKKKVAEEVIKPNISFNSSFIHFLDMSLIAA